MKYEEVILKTYHRNEVMLYFLELFKKKQSDSLLLEPDCRVKLIARINMYIRNGIYFLDYKEDDNLNEILYKMENTIATSYESFRYTFRIATSSAVIKNYKPIFETKIRDEDLMCLKANISCFYGVSILKEWTGERI